MEGKPLSAASVAVSDLAVHLDGRGGLGDAIGRSATVLVESLVEHTEERLLLGGTANLTRNTADFGGSLRSVLEALEEQVVVLRLLAAQQEAGKVTVRIGHETEAEQMAGTSVVSTAYGSIGQGVRRHGCAGTHSDGLSGNHRQRRRGCSVHRRSLRQPLGRPRQR